MSFNIELVSPLYSSISILFAIVYIKFNWYTELTRKHKLVRQIYATVGLIFSCVNSFVTPLQVVNRVKYSLTKGLGSITNPQSRQIFQGWRPHLSMLPPARTASNTRVLLSIRKTWSSQRNHFFLTRWTMSIWPHNWYSSHRQRYSPMSICYKSLTKHFSRRLTRPPHRMSTSSMLLNHIYK